MPNKKIKGKAKPQIEEPKFDGGTLDTAEIIGDKSIYENRVKKYRNHLMSKSGAFYANNYGHWTRAMRFMRSIGDKKAERAIYMARFHHERAEYSMGVLQIIGGAASTLFTVESAAVFAAETNAIIAARAIAGNMSWKRQLLSLLQLDKGNTYWRMAINAGTQALIEKDGVRGINAVSMLAEGMPLALGTFTPMIEVRPFRKQAIGGENPKFRITGYNKSISETFFDMGMQNVTSYINGKGSQATWSFLEKYNKGAIEGLERLVINNFTFPAIQSVFQTSTQMPADKVKKNLSDRNIID